LRIPAWADAKTRVSINGKRVGEEVQPGKFLALRRSWKAGDRIGYEVGMPLRLEQVDAQNANTVALIRGPLALFAVGNIPPNLTRQQLLAATAVSEASQDWTVSSDSQSLTLRPFSVLRDESYRLYHKVEA
jgi:DUF1680 family protein